MITAGINKGGSNTSWPMKGAGRLCLFVLSGLMISNNLHAQVSVIIGSGMGVRANDFKISLDGNWRNNGSFIAGTGTVAFVGPLNATITASSKQTFYNLTLNKAGGSLVISDTVVVTNTLTLAAGRVKSGSTLLDITNTAVGAVVATAGIVDGKIRRALVASNASGTYLFNDASTSFTANGTNPTSVLFHSFPNTPPPYGNDPNTNAIRRYYTITATGGSGSRSLSLSYRNASAGGDTIETNGLDPAGFSLWRGDGTVWTDQGGVVTSPVSNPPNSGKVVATTAGFSNWNWTVASAEGALPIQLASFSATVSGGRVLLEWMTLSESNNYGFFIQRRRDDEMLFAEIPNSFTPGHGTTVEPQHYSYIDSTLMVSATYHYRLVQMDLDGSVHYSHGIAIEYIVSGVQQEAQEIPHGFRVYQNYPNPFNPETQIRYGLPEAAYVQLVVYDVLGREIRVLVNEHRPAGIYEVSWDGSESNGADVTSGVYFYRLQAGSFSQIRRMLLIR